MLRGQHVTEVAGGVLCEMEGIFLFSFSYLYLFIFIIHNRIHAAPGLGVDVEAVKNIIGTHRLQTFVQKGVAILGLWAHGLHARLCPPLGVRRHLPEVMLQKCGYKRSTEHW